MFEAVYGGGGGDELRGLIELLNPLVNKLTHDLLNVLPPDRLL